MRITHHGLSHLPADARSVTDNSLSEIPGGESEIRDMHNPAITDHPVWVIPLDDKGVRVVSPDGSMFTDVGPGSVALAQEGAEISASGKYLCIRLPGFKGPTMGLSGDMGAVLGYPGAVVREILELGDRLTLASMRLRREFVQGVSQPDGLVICVVLRGYAMALGWRPGEEDAAIDVLGGATDQRISPLTLIRAVEDGEASTLQEAFQNALQPAGSGGLRDNPAIGSEDSRLLLAQPLCPQSVMVVHPGDMVALANVESWVPPTLLVLNIAMV